MNSSNLHNLVSKMATDLCVPGATRDAKTFLRLSGMDALTAHPNAYSDVASGSVPLEVSFSQACPNDLRLLVEPCLPGESILARTVMGLEAIRDTVTEFFSSELAQQSYNFARHLLPDGEEIAHLNWHSSVWLALRVADGPPALRVYVNAQLREAGDRWLRIRRALLASRFNDYIKVLNRMRDKVDKLIEPVGFSFDIRQSGITPARVHCVTDKITPYWMMRLFNAVNYNEAIDDAADFMDLFGLLGRRGECPILVSIGLGQNEIGSLKIDVDLPNLNQLKPAGQTHHLTDAEERFGKIAGYHNAGEDFRDKQPRYIGMTIAKNVQYLNVYLPCTFKPQQTNDYTISTAFEKARAFVGGQLESKGALLMDARSSSTTARVIPPLWPDLYMTSLLIQEHSTALNVKPCLLERAQSYVLSAQEDSYWRYLPELPCDLDDSAMAWLALNSLSFAIKDSFFRKLMEMANPDGGFPTFIGDRLRGQLSHPAVTLNISLLLDRANIDWPSSDTDLYLGRWLQQPDFPNCEWLGSRLFPIFLFARSTHLLERLGSPARKQLISTILRMQRTDGAWGASFPDGLDTALAVVSLDLLCAEIPRTEAVRHLLLTLQLYDGGWGWSPLYSDGSGTWFGHRAITTAMAFRALEILDSGK